MTGSSRTSDSQKVRKVRKSQKPRHRSQDRQSKKSPFLQQSHKRSRSHSSHKRDDVTVKRVSGSSESPFLPRDHLLYSGKDLVDLTGEVVDLTEEFSTVTRNKDDRIHKRLKLTPPIESGLNLPWPIPHHMSLSIEESLLPIIMHRGERERDMMKNQPSFRLHEINKQCRKFNLDILSVCSLRRHHIKKNNPYKDMTALGLGRRDHIKQAADLFEECIKQYLEKFTIQYQDENAQRARCRRLKQQLPPTPDFLFRDTIRIHDSGNDMNIHWLEAKMFYGASTIPADNVSAVGRILTTAEKYVKLYGKGAMCFSYGCGQVLADELWKRGVIALDATPLNLAIVECHQRNWCGDKNGRILP